MATVNGEAGFTQLTKLNATESLLLNGNPVLTAPDMEIERLVDGQSAAASQEPTGTGDANKIQLEFGAAQNTASDPVQLLADGTLRFNQAGTYRLKIAINYGRSGAAGTSLLVFRALINGTQAGRSVAAKISSAEVLVPFTDEAWLTVPAGIDITYEIARDATGANSGGAFSGGITLSGWEIAPSAAIRVERWK